jgi:hypothetical protein
MTKIGRAALQEITALGASGYFTTEFTEVHRGSQRYITPWTSVKNSVNSVVKKSSYVKSPTD